MTLTVPPPPDPATLLAEVPDSAWARLSTRVIYFGHQSVGADIVRGVRELMDTDARIRLKFLPLDSAAPGSGAFLEGTIGTNGDPESKTAAFVRGLTAPGHSTVQIALHKYCYLDFGPGTDPAAVFGAYEESTTRLRQERPDLEIVHVTTPLTTNDGWARGLVKRILGRTTAADLNAKRARYNALLRAAYGERDPLFDLAAFEATDPAGRQLVSRADGDAVPSLAAAYTDDGGHLNATGRRVVATRFLVFLAQLP
jgi:hypothetical protein